MRQLAFVYGTLKNGYGNNRILQYDGCQYLGKARTVSNNYTLHHLGGFPGLHRGGTTTVMGEVFEVDDAAVARMDRLEGHPSFYTREKDQVMLTNVETEIEEEVEVSLYIYQGHADNIVESGDWN